MGQKRYHRPLHYYTAWVRFFGRHNVRVVDGPFRGFEVIFVRYLSGLERVAILLSTIETAGLRVVLPASALAKCS